LVRFQLVPRGKLAASRRERGDEGDDDLLTRRSRVRVLHDPRRGRFIALRSLERPFSDLDSMSHRLPPMRANYPVPLVTETAALAGSAVYLVRYQAITTLRATH